MQQRFRRRPGHQIGGHDEHLRENFSGIRPWLAGTGIRWAIFSQRSGTSSIELSRAELPAGPHVFPEKSGPSMMVTPPTSEPSARPTTVCPASCSATRQSSSSERPTSSDTRDVFTSSGFKVWLGD
jgi:hypothetical protein